MLSYIDIGKGFGFWKTIPTLRRRPMTSVLGARMFSPSMLIVPSTRADDMKSFILLRHLR